MRNPRLKTASAILALALVPAFVPLLAGCDQKTKGWINQKSDQASNASNEQAAATQGSQVYLYVVNAPGKDGLPSPGDLQLGAGSTPELLALAGSQVTSDGAGSSTQGAKAGYVQSGFTINVTTGGTAPSLTGSSTNSATQTPSQTSTQSPTQHIDPRLSTSVPIAVGQPGSMIDQQATAATEGSTASPTKTSENDLRYAEIKATADKLEAMLPLLEKLLGAPTQLPETPPVDVPPVDTTGE